MIRIEDYSDEELMEELKDRGFAVYKGKEMKKTIKKLEGLQKFFIDKSKELQMKGSK